MTGTLTQLAALTPDRIMQLGFGYWGSKTLLSAVELGLFTELTEGALDAESLQHHLRIHQRGAGDFFDALVALGMLERHDGQYSNIRETDLFLDRAKPSYSGGFLELSSMRLYGFWTDLTEGVRRGEPQNEAKTGGNLFDVIYRDPALPKEFAHATTGISMGTAKAIAQMFPWSRYCTFADLRRSSPTRYPRQMRSSMGRYCTTGAPRRSTHYWPGRTPHCRKEARCWSTRPSSMITVARMLSACS